MSALPASVGAVLRRNPLRPKRRAALMTGPALSWRSDLAAERKVDWAGGVSSLKSIPRDVLFAHIWRVGKPFQPTDRQDVGARLNQFARLLRVSPGRVEQQPCGIGAVRTKCRIQLVQVDFLPGRIGDHWIAEALDLKRILAAAARSPR